MDLTPLDGRRAGPITTPGEEREQSKESMNNGGLAVWACGSLGEERSKGPVCSVTGTCRSRSTVAIPVCVGVGGADRPNGIGPELPITRIRPRRPEGRRGLLSPPSAPYKGPSSPAFIFPLWWPCWHFNLRLALGRWVRSSPTSTCPRSSELREAIPFHRVTLVARQLPSRY